MRSVLIGLLLLPGCGPADSEMPPDREVAPPTVSVPAPATDREDSKSLEVRERILLEELSRLARMGPGAASRIDRVLWISRWSEATLEPARAALERIDPAGKLRVPALLQLESEGIGDSEYPGIEPDEEFNRLGMTALRPLLEVVAGPPGDKRRVAIEYLAGLPDAARDIVPVLTPISRDPEDPEREAALWSLYQLAPGRPGLLAELRQADMLWCCMPEEGEDVLEMAKVRPELIALLHSLLTSSDSDEREYAGRKLRRATNLPREILPALVDCLEDSDLWVRVQAALALVKAAPDTAGVAVALVDVFELDDPDYWYGDLYREVCLALRELGPRAREAAPALARHLSHRSYLAVLEVAEALRYVDAPEVAIPALLELMVEPLPDGELPPLASELNSRMATAAISLASYGDRFPGAVGLFVKYLPCNQWRSRGHPRSAVRGREYIRGRAWAARALGMLGPSAKASVPALATALEYDSMCSYVAADALVKVGGPGIDALVDALEHPQESVRETAASRLAPLCLPEHEIVLRRALTDQSEYVRANVCAALIRLDPAARDVIAEALRVVKNKDFGPDRFWLLDVAEEVGPRARPLLEAAARSEDAAVREKAVELLRK